MIEFHKVCFTYPGCEKNHNRVLHNIDIRFEKGKFYSLIGSNGSGKSTLARLINGLIHPFEGKIYIDGLEVLPQNFIEIRQKVGYIFQNPENQIVSTIVENEVAFALENLGIPYDEMHRKVTEILEFVELNDMRKRPPHNLSGGQKQRLAIASVVVMEPDYIIFDEPTSMLDYNGRREVINSIKKLHKAGKTIILISHDAEEIVLADEIIILHEGEIVAKKRPIDFLKDVDLRNNINFQQIPDHLKFAIKYNINTLNKEEIIDIMQKNILPTTGILTL
ncbi:MAG: ATP-binding cassette domain-containing protein [Candidatus Muirbacterium halophilum]|nr:ATP-binding cassette domain-containing protein [Candidatus Muirbacterium halophilum]MCK9475215.1 ATP-binding cassette domain-containing protein [Candidatus Muirbacterium halophilum]